MATSIPVARTFGPEKLSYYMYLQWLTNISGTLAMVGIPATVRKYMAEYLGRSDFDSAWAIYRTGLRFQSWISAGLLAAGSVLVARAVEPGYRVIALFMLGGVAAKMIACVPSNANTAGGHWRINFISTVIYSSFTVLAVYVCLWAGWGLVGVAASFSLGMVAETLAKSIMALRWLPRAPQAVLSPELRRRMFRFSGQGMVLLALQLVVWDRSDLVFLRWLDKDKAQLSFFAVAFNFIDKILNLPQAFSQVVGVSVMSEYGRDPKNLRRFVSTAVKYALMVTVPIMVGCAAISSALIRSTYGKQYLEVIPVLAIGALLAAAKPLLGPLQSLLQAEERQGFLIGWTVCCGVLNVVLDIALIPVAGARGAMVANGLAQLLAVLGVWVRARTAFSLPFQASEVIRILFSGAVMAAVVVALQWTGIPAWTQLAAGIPLGALTYFAVVRCLRILDRDDATRLHSLAGGLRGKAGAIATGCLNLVVPNHEAAQTVS
jgi:O-antigen/teichoic acid export membrane protein